MLLVALTLRWCTGALCLAKHALPSSHSRYCVESPDVVTKNDFSDVEVTSPLHEELDFIINKYPFHLLYCFFFCLALCK